MAAEVNGIPVEEEEYEVETILAKEEIEGKVFYFIKWKGFPDTWNTWEPETIMDCPEKIQEFEEKLRQSQKKDDSEDKDNDDVRDASFLHKKKSARKSTSGGRRQRKKTKRSSTLTQPSLSHTASSQDMASPASKVKPPRKETRTRPNIRDGRQTTFPPNQVQGPVLTELTIDVKGDWIAVYKEPGEEAGKDQVKMMFYCEFKEKYPASVIDFLEKHLKFGDKPNPMTTSLKSTRLRLIEPKDKSD